MMQRFGDETPRGRGEEKFDYSRFSKQLRTSRPQQDAGSGELVDIVRMLRESGHDSTVRVESTFVDVRRAPRNILEDSPARFWSAPSMAPVCLALHFSAPVCPILLSLSTRGCTLIEVRTHVRPDIQAPGPPARFSPPSDAVSLTSSPGATADCLSATACVPDARTSDVRDWNANVVTFALSPQSPVMIDRVEFLVKSISAEAVIVHNVAISGIPTNLKGMAASQKESMRNDKRPSLSESEGEPMSDAESDDGLQVPNASPTNSGNARQSSKVPGLALGLSGLQSS